jgi:hypothetical protein
LETVERDYSPKGVRFYYVYKALAHPEHERYVTPFTLKERLMHIEEAERRLGSRITWLCDGMSNDLKSALGGVPNAELLIDPEGRVARRRAWSDPDALRDDLAELVGPVEKPTRVSDLELKTTPPPDTVATGIVPRIELPGGMRPLLIEPLLEDTKLPFYVKLRAEADAGLLRSGAGKLYLGFHLDPLYHVHWNNLAKPLEFELSVPETVRVSPPKGSAPKVQEPADADPREFLIDVRGGEAGPLELTVRYFACDDANTFCVPVTQRYVVHLEPDPHGGRVSTRGGRGAGPRRNREDMAARMMRWDANGDGRLARDEAPDRMRDHFDRIDTNGDGVIDADEIEAMAERMQQRRGGAR